MSPPFSWFCPHGLPWASQIHGDVARIASQFRFPHWEWIVIFARGTDWNQRSFRFEKRNTAKRFLSSPPVRFPRANKAAQRSTTTSKNTRNSKLRTGNSYTGPGERLGSWYFPRRGTTTQLRWWSKNTNINETVENPVKHILAHFYSAKTYPGSFLILQNISWLTLIL